MTVTLRRAVESDCKRLWDWVNDPDVRSASFSSEPIPWSTHCEWFRKKLSDPNCILWIAEDEQSLPIGQVRMDLSSEEAVITISIDRNRRGKGYAEILIRFAAETLFQQTPIQSIHAYIKPGNERSIRSFENAGFRKTEGSPDTYRAALHYALLRN